MTPDPSASAPSITGAPPRNVVYGTVVGVLSAVVVALLKLYLGSASPDLLNVILPAVPVLVGALVAYLVPMTQGDVADRTTNHTVKLADLNPVNPTTAGVDTETASDKRTALALATGAVPVSMLDAVKAGLGPPITAKTGNAP